MNRLLSATIIVLVLAGVGVGAYFGITYYLQQLSNSNTPDTALPPANNTAYNIELLLHPTVSPAYLPAIYRATTTWQEAINGSLPTQILLYRFEAEERCGFTFDAPSRLVEDLLVYVNFASIDGPGGVLGVASWCILDGNRMPRVAFIRFDAGDVANLLAAGTLQSVMTHEMGHCLGIGTAWELRTTGGVFLRQYITPDTDPLPWLFLRPEARIGEAEITGNPVGPYPEIENTGGEGTARGHWKESRYTHELMTGFITGSSQPLSLLTLRSMIDLGYQMNLSVADSFSARRRYLRDPVRVAVGNDVVRMPVYYAATEIQKV